jgi:hypothetical protein
VKVCGNLMNVSVKFSDRLQLLVYGNLVNVSVKFSDRLQLLVYKSLQTNLKIIVQEQTLLLTVHTAVCKLYHTVYLFCIRERSVIFFP